jgi:hypothetical protein
LRILLAAIRFDSKISAGSASEMQQTPLLTRAVSIASNSLRADRWRAIALSVVQFNPAAFLFLTA